LSRRRLCYRENHALLFCACYVVTGERKVVHKSGAYAITLETVNQCVTRGSREARTGVCAAAAGRERTAVYSGGEPHGAYSIRR